MSFSVLPQPAVCLTKHLVLSIPTPKHLSQQSLLHPHGRAQCFITCPLLVSLTSSLARGLHSSRTEILSVPGNRSSLLFLKPFPLLSVAKVTSTFSLENSYVFLRNLSRCHFCGKSSQRHNQGINIAFGYAREYSPFSDLVGQMVETFPGILYGALLLKQTLNMMLF